MSMEDKKIIPTKREAKITCFIDMLQNQTNKWVYLFYKPYNSTMEEVNARLDAIQFLGCLLCQQIVCTML